MTAGNPWLSIPAADYQGHMGPDGVDQAGPLRALFAAVYRDLLPQHLAVAGCGTGDGLEVVDASVTGRLLGVDINPEYIALARARHPGLAGVAQWIASPLETCDPAGGDGAFDLVHAALFFEHVDPALAIGKLARWVAPGGTLSVVLQLPGGDGAVSATAFTTLRRLDGHMHLVPPAHLCDLAAREGLRVGSSKEVPVARGKRLWAGRFRDDTYRFR
jgi:SAM-dependent methyltransferase